MRYAIDIHGTLAIRSNGRLVTSEIFQLLAGLMRAWVLKGDEVYVCSGPTRSVIEAELKELGLESGIHFTHIESVVDFLHNSGVEMYQNPPDSGRWWCSNEDWNRVKGQIAELRGIDIVVDDTLAYAKAMPSNTQFCLVTPDAKPFS